MITLAEAKAIYRTGKGHFFDRETFKYWGSRIESALYKNRCFVTSENNFDGSRRAYTVRRFSPDFLHVETVGEFQEHATKWGAREAVIPDTMQDQIRRFIFGEPEAPNSTCKYCGVWQA